MKTVLTTKDVKEQVAEHAAGLLARYPNEHFSFFVDSETQDLGLTRVGAYNRITDNVESETGGSSVMVALGKRLGMTTSYETDQEVGRAVARAIMIAHNSPPVEWFRGFPRLKRTRMMRRSNVLGAKERGEILAKAIAFFEKDGFKLSGAVASTAYTRRLYSSENETYDEDVAWSGSQLLLSLAITDDDNTFEATIGGVGRKPSDLSLDTILADGKEQILLQESLPVVELGPGAYNTVFEAPALANIMEFTSWYGLNGGQHHRNGSFLSKQQLGDRVFGKNITITDEPLHKMNPCWMPTDSFGVPKQNRFVFVQDGELKRVWYDYLSAMRHDKTPTGHGFELAYGPGHLVLGTGDGPSTRDEALKKLNDGLLVRSLHYTRLEDIGAGTFTGMTRYGTYLVNDGEIIARVPNLRFLESIPRMLQNAAWISKKSSAEPASEIYGISSAPVCIVPSFAQINGFRVTGATPMQ